MLNFYSQLGGQKALWKSSGGRWDNAGPLRSKEFIRLQDGSHVAPFRDDGAPNVYLTIAENVETSLPIIKTGLLRNKDVQAFLTELGIPELDIVAEVIEKVLPKYRSFVPLEEHKHDIAKIVCAYKTDSYEKKKRLKEKLENTAFILTKMESSENDVYRKPVGVYFPNEELRKYFLGNDNVGFVSLDYEESVSEMLESIGVSHEIRIGCKSKPGSTEIVQLDYRCGYRRGIKGFDPDINVDGLEFAIKNQTVERSLIIWNTIAVPYSHCIKGKVLRSSRQDFSPNAGTYKEEEIISTFGNLLINADWLPNSGQQFVRPCELSLDDLPNSFIRDEKLAIQLGMKRDFITKLAEEAGIPVENIELMKRYPKDFQKWKLVMTAKKEKPAFPQKESIKPERRQERLVEQLGDAPDKETEDRERSVRVTRGAVDPALWLMNQYTNDAGQMLCQICKEEMPFKKRNGEYYFEAIEELSKDYFSKEHEAQFLALCPLCAAMYKEFVKLDENAMRALKNALMNSEDPEVSLDLGELKTSVRFVESHWQDIKTILQESGPISQ